MSNQDYTMDQAAQTLKTMFHIERVRNYLSKCIKELLQRQEDHDQSKLVSPEMESFAENTPILAGLTYGQPEYKAALDAMKPGIKLSSESCRFSLSLISV